jgi:hypothetical protein
VQRHVAEQLCVSFKRRIVSDKGAVPNLKGVSVMEKDVLALLEKVQFFYLATVDGQEARVRPFSFQMSPQKVASC